MTNKVNIDARSDVCWPKNRFEEKICRMELGTKESPDKSLMQEPVIAAVSIRPEVAAQTDDVIPVWFYFLTHGAFSGKHDVVCFGAVCASQTNRRRRSRRSIVLSCIIMSLEHTTEEVAAV